MKLHQKIKHAQWVSAFLLTKTKHNSDTDTEFELIWLVSLCLAAPTPLLTTVTSTCTACNIQTPTVSFTHPCSDHCNKTKYTIQKMPIITLQCADKFNRLQLKRTTSLFWQLLGQHVKQYNLTLQKEGHQNTQAKQMPSVEKLNCHDFIKTTTLTRNNYWVRISKVNIDQTSRYFECCICSYMIKIWKSKSGSQQCVWQSKAHYISLSENTIRKAQF